MLSYTLFALTLIAANNTNTQDPMPNVTAAAAECLCKVASRYGRAHTGRPQRHADTGGADCVGGGQSDSEGGALSRCCRYAVVWNGCLVSFEFGFVCVFNSFCIRLSVRL